jgi:hypothetical protein
VCSDVIRPNVLTISIRVSWEMLNLEEIRVSIFHAFAFVAKELCSGLWTIGQKGKTYFEFSSTVPRSRIMHRHDAHAYVGLHV